MTDHNPLPPLIMFDLDKTLARSKEPLTEVMALLFARLSIQTRIAVISGGKLEQLIDQVIKHLPPSAHLSRISLLPTSGAALFVYENGTWEKVYQEELSTDEINRIEAAILTGVQKSGIVDASIETYGEQIENRGAEVSFSALGQHAPIDAKEAWDPNDTKRPLLRDAIAELLPEFDVKVGGSTTIDITKKGVNKAYGVRRLADYAHLPIGEMLYVGDALFPGGNDAIVQETSIKTHAVHDPQETEAFIQNLLGN